MVGDKTIEGKEAVFKAIREMAENKMSECVIEKILTARKRGCVKRNHKYEKGKEYTISDFYEFKNTI